MAVLALGEVAHAAILVIAKRLLNLIGRVHHKWAPAGDRFADRFAGQDQKPGRRL